MKSGAEAQGHSETKEIFSFAHNRKWNRKLEKICGSRVRYSVSSALGKTEERNLNLLKPYNIVGLLSPLLTLSHLIFFNNPVS